MAFLPDETGPLIFHLFFNWRSRGLRRFNDLSISLILTGQDKSSTILIYETIDIQQITSQSLRVRK